MRILTITSSYPKYRGDTTAPFIASITSALAQRGHELVVVLPGRSDLQPEPIPGVAFHPYRYAPTRSLEVFGYAEALRGDVELRGATVLVAPLAIASGAAKTWGLARRGGFDLIHAHWVIPNGAMALPACTWSGLPMVVSLHGSDVFVSERSPVFRLAARMALRRAAQVTACSQDLALRGLALGIREAPVTIPYGVNIEQFRPSADGAQRLRANLGLGARAPVVLAVGRLVHKKGFEVLVEATPRMVSVYPELRVVIAGHGDLKPALEARSAELGVAAHIRLVGNVPREDLPDYYAMATVVAVPSIQDDAGNVDGLPNVLLESMASGAAIVASAVAGIPQTVRDRQEALLVPERDAEALARAVLEILGSPETRSCLGTSARARAKNLHGWSQVGERFEAVFRSVTEARR